MSEIINIEHLSKQYRIGALKRTNSFRDLFDEKMRSIFKKREEKRSSSENTIWALENISFAVQRGEVRGIIGCNGAGKSTLLKILSRITEPTKGKISLRGKVSSLLEIGTGFSGELSGRENIYFNGAVLGMRKAEIERKFDEIVNFAEIEKFIDTPVKHYSSGMYMRLAFAVAAYLEPDILIVDEVLAVGDALFQKKCLGKMEDVSRNEGRTVLFVSHNMGVISQLCEKTLVLENGRLCYLGKTSQAVDHYLKQGKQDSKTINRANLSREANHFVLVKNVDASMHEKHEFNYDEEINLFVSLNLPCWSASLELAVSLYDKNRKRIFTIHEPLKKYYVANSILEFQITIPAKFIVPGTYSWLMCINRPGVELYDLLDNICDFSVAETGSDFARYYGSDYGVVFAKYKIRKIN